jgi:hypothetical protein
LYTKLPNGTFVKPTSSNMENKHTHPPSLGYKEANKTKAKFKISSYSTPKANTKKAKSSDTRAPAKKLVAHHGKFNLPPRHTQEVIHINNTNEDSRNANKKEWKLNNDHSSDNKDKDDEAHSTHPIHAKVLSFQPSTGFTHLTTTNLSLKKIPLTKVKAKAATHTEADRQIIHIYLQATIQIKANMPDWPGLMKVYVFLHFQVGTNATAILVLPSKFKLKN